MPENGDHTIFSIQTCSPFPEFFIDQPRHSYSLHDPMMTPFSRTNN
jgi:hypothetical protein